MAEDPLAVLRETMGALGALAKLAVDDDVDDEMMEKEASDLFGPVATKMLKMQSEALEETRTLLLTALDHWSGIPDWWRERAEKVVFPLGRPSTEGGG